MDWLTEIAGCQNDPEAINWEGAEDALLELEERAQECFDYCAEGDQTPEVAMLYEMGETMERIADRLNEFLETEEFHHLGEAIADCATLMTLRDQIAGDQSDSLL